MRRLLPGAVAGLAVTIAGQSPPVFDITLTDGDHVAGPLVDWRGDAVSLRDGAATRALPFDRILFLHGPATNLARAGRMILHLPRGQELCGEVVGGDEEGESLTLRTAALGALRVPLDRLLLLRVKQGDRFYRVEHFAALTGDEGKEIVYRWTPLGLDPVGGVLDRITAEGVRFEWRGQTDLFPWEKIAGVRLPLFEDATEAGAAAVEVVLLTSDGCRVRGAPLGMDQGALLLRSPELGDLHIAVERVLAGHVLAANRVFVSTLTPEKIDERHFFKPETDHPWRRDQSVEGEPLSVRQRYWTTGLGCHSLSRLSYRVPDGVRTLLAWVGPDASAVAEDHSGDMDFEVFVNGKSAAKATGVRGGQDAQRLPPVPVAQGDEVVLELGFGGNAHILDRGNWLAPVFLR